MREGKWMKGGLRKEDQKRGSKSPHKGSPEAKEYQINGEEGDEMERKLIL